MYLGRKLLFLFLVLAATCAGGALSAALPLPVTPLPRWIAGGALFYVLHGLFCWLGDLVFQHIAPARPPAGRTRASVRRWSRRFLWAGTAAIVLGGVAGLEWLACMGTIALLFGLETWFAGLPRYSSEAEASRSGT